MPCAYVWIWIEVRYVELSEEQGEAAEHYPGMPLPPLQMCPLAGGTLYRVWLSCVQEDVMPHFPHWAEKDAGHIVPWD